MEGTGDPSTTNGTGDAVGHLNEAPGDATTTVTSVPASPGGDKVLVATSGDVGMEVTGEPGVTGGPGDTLGHLTEVPGDATTTVPPVPVTPGGDKALVGTSGDAAMEGTEDPGATSDPRDAVGHLSEAPGDATTAVTSVPVTPGGDKEPGSPHGDVAMEVTAQPGVTGGPGDVVGHLSEAPGDATTMVPPVPVTPGGDKVLVATHGDVTMEVTGEPGVTGGPGDAVGHLSEAPGDATTVVAFVTTSPGSDKALVGTSGDVGMEVTGEPGVTGGPGDMVGHLSEVPGDATTAVPPAPVTPGGDKVLVGTRGDVAMEGTEDPGATNATGDTLGHLTEAPGDATTMVTSVPVTPGGDKVLVGTHGDAAVEGTEETRVLCGPGDSVGHLNETSGDATTVVPPATTSPGGDKVLVGTQSDVAMEGTEDPGVTGCPGDIVGHLNETPGDATTTVPPVPVTPGGDKALVATQSDVSVEGTEDPGVTSGPGDTLGHLNESPGDATTVVAPVTTPPGSDKLLVATEGGVAMEGTAQPDVTGGPGDIVGHLSETPGDATTTVTSVPVSPGGDKVLVSTQSDVTVGGTEDPGVTGGPGDTLGGVNEAPGDATTAAVTSVPASGKTLLANGSDVAMEGTEDPGATNATRDTLGHLTEAPRDATTTVTSVPATPGGDKALVANGGDVAAEGTEETRVLCGHGDTLGRVPEAPGDATTTVPPVPVTPGGDKVLVGTQSDVTMEGTEDPGVTGGPGDVVGHLNEAPGDATTVVAFVTTSPGSDKVLAGTSGDVGMEVTGEPGVTGGPGDMVGHLSEAPGDATTAVPSVPVTPGGDKALVGTQSDIGMEVTGEPGATNDPRDAVGHLSEAPGDATTVVPPVAATPGGDKTLLANGSDVTMEGTEDPGATNGTGDTLGHLTEAPRDATTAVPPAATPPGSDAPPMSRPADVTMGVAAPPTAPNCSWDSLGRVPDVPKDQSAAATTPPAPVTSPLPSSAPSRGDAIMVAPGGDVMAPPPCRGPAPHAALPVTAAPPPGLASSAPFPSWPRPLLLVPLLLLLP